MRLENLFFQQREKNSNTMKIAAIAEKGERENIEFKEFLLEEVHLRDDRRQSLACQMKHRMIMGNGTAVYLIGVTDSGSLKGISRERFQETISVLNSIALEVGAEIVDCKEDVVNDNDSDVDGDGDRDGDSEEYVGLVTIKTRNVMTEHILVGSAGHVDHGKSTLIGSLITGIHDDGSGKTSIFLDVQPHEIERGLSADLSFGVYGFRSGKTLHLKNPLSKKEQASLVESAEKLVSFVDTVGHEPWLRTTIRGIVGQKLDYGLLVVAADDGVTRVTKEHLGILLAMDLPTIVAITKKDRVDERRIAGVEKQIFDLLRIVGKIPLRVKSKSDLHLISNKLNKGVIVPIIQTSSVTRAGLDLLDQLLFQLPKRNFESEKPFQLYIDKIYQMAGAGAGTVVSGSIKQGMVRAGDQLLLGPMVDGNFKSVRVQSIEIHYYRTDQASAGEIVGVALKGVSPKDVGRGMVLCRGNNKAIKEFDAEIFVLYHPTRIKKGYEPVVHLETIAEVAVFERLDRDYMMAGQSGRVTMRFKFHPYYIYDGQKFIFREGTSRGIGQVVRVYE